MNSAIEIAAAGPGVYKAVGLLVLALVFKLVATIFTFGMKVSSFFGFEFFDRAERESTNVTILKKKHLEET